MPKSQGDNEKFPCPTRAIPMSVAWLGQLLISASTSRSTSFRSVFQLLRMGHCPYFYLCANHFTVLFVSADVMGCAHTTALLAPTTGGFRQALRKEGETNILYDGSLQTVTLVDKLRGLLWLTLKTILTHLLTMLLEIVECLLLQLSLIFCGNVRQI